MSNVSAIAVFCGSKFGENPAHRDAAATFGRQLAERGIRLVYGGGRIGLMGVIADAVLDAGGKVSGVIPSFMMDFEVAHGSLTERIEVGSMHERKNTMFEMADAFVVLPGGLGTMDEGLEIITWKQLRLHSKPVVVADLDGYWQPWQRLIDHMIAGGFAHAKVRELYSVVDRVEDIFGAIATAPEPAPEVLTSHLL